MKYCLFFKLIDFVKITARIVKVNTLVSYLLVLVLVYIMRKSLDGREEDLSFRLERRSRRDTQKILNDLALTNDTALISTKIYQAQEALNSWSLL